MKTVAVKKTLLCLLFAACLLLAGCAAKAAIYEPSKPKLDITLNPDEDSYGYQSQISPYTPSALEIIYSGVSAPTISLDGTSYALEDALSQDKLTLETVLAWACDDQKAGFCTKEVVSEHGLTQYQFTYHNRFDLAVICDIYETPDGQQHQIQRLYLRPPYENRNSTVDFTNALGIALDREDWGLEFSANAQESGVLKLNCTQSGGQQIGELGISGISLVDEASGDPLQPQADFAPRMLPMDSQGILELDLFSIYGPLPAGDYRLILTVSDYYAEDDVHPLMDNFYDEQDYTLTFTVH